MNFTEREEGILQALLQEQSQYREEVRMFDAHLFRVILTYITALVAAFGWLGAQVIEKAATSTSNPENIGPATKAVVAGLAAGPFFYLFAALPLISSIMFLYVARDWASLNERFALLKIVSQQIATLLREDEDVVVFRFDQGHEAQGKKLRSTIEITLVTFWMLGVAIITVILGWNIGDHAIGWVRQLWWAFCCLGIVLLVIGGFVALGIFLTRKYKNPDPERECQTQNEKDVEADRR